MSHRILLIEDEMMIADALHMALSARGYQVVAWEEALEPALQSARSAEVDLAILDVNLNGFSTVPVADVLRARWIPVVVVTGYGMSAREDFPGYTLLQKPVDIERLMEVMEQALTARS